MNFVQYETKERIGYITLNRPEKRNALNYEVVSELTEAFSAAENDKETKVIILKSTGDAFCAGADLAYLQQLQQNSLEENLEDSRHLKELYYKIYTLKKVVIAQVHGHAIAGGCGLATVCDFAMSVPEAKFGYTEVRIGFIPAIVMVFLLRKVGEMKAKEMLLTGELFDAETAVRNGLINRVVQKDELEFECNQFAKVLAGNNSAESMAATKEMIFKVQSIALEDALEYAATMNAKARGSEDCKKGISSFLNKEKIIW